MRYYSQVDVFDRKILQLLSVNGKLTQGQLAERIGLSLSACQRRVKTLEDSNAIIGYRAIIDPELLDERRIIIVGINLEHHRRSDIQAFQASIIRMPQVKEVHHIAGTFDYILKVAVRDIDAYERFHADDLASVKGIVRITSFIAMSTFKG